eukprot:scaffold64469_cov17-Tisochrysis_lutea.AAC.2
MAVACRVVQVRPGQGAFVQLLPIDWAETVPPKMAYLPQSEFTDAAPKGFAIESVLPKGTLIKVGVAAGPVPGEKEGLNNHVRQCS